MTTSSASQTRSSTKKVLPLAGRVALITGASGGIGSATARELARQGASVILAARRGDVLDALASELGASGVEALAVPTDLTDATQIEPLVERALERFGRIDILVNNAGIGTPRSLAKTAPDAIRRELEINLVGAVLLTHAVLPGMLERKSGAIISIASVAGHVAVEPLYSATKFGIRGFSLALRRQLRGSGVTVSVVSPGYISTPMTRGNKLPMPGPEVVAKRIAKLARKPKREVIVPGIYRIALWFERYLPWLVDLGVRFRR
ncbi:MAG TPA: SDR family NAD(P)-dependent oxidoreductase [Ktedonobacterales bacterium]|jgi:short-subunit dehydrogenase|nr:SDR family NAD(P)-dependent oxidoreductase [Ktedonobacterales bacterium]